jgi:hypothetical protein
MPKFKVVVVYYTYCTATVEAENAEEAYKQANELDGDAFTPSNEHFDWHIDQISEVD